MKNKIITTMLIFVFLLAGVCSAVFLLPGASSIIEISLLTNNVCAYVGDEIDVVDDNIVSISANNSDYRLLLSTLSPNVNLSQTQHSIICVSQGTATVKVEVKCGGDCKSKLFSITILPLPLYPTDIDFQYYAITLGINDVNAHNTMTLTGTTNVQPLVEYSNEDICVYNPSTGSISPLGYGQTTVTVKYGDLSKTFSVDVGEFEARVEYDILRLSTYYRLNYCIKDSNNNLLSNQNVSIRFLTNSANLIVIQQDSNIIMLSAPTGNGSCELIITSVANENIVSRVLII